MTTAVRTRVAIIGAGPAGLFLAHLLGNVGIETIVVDQRSREEIEQTIRAGILEQGTVEALIAPGVQTRVQTVGHRHDGIELRFAGEGHRVDFSELVGRSVWLYPQHEVLKDLIATLQESGHDLRFGTTAHHVDYTDPLRPRVVATGPGGEPFVISPHPERRRPVTAGPRAERPCGPHDVGGSVWGGASELFRLRDALRTPRCPRLRDLRPSGRRHRLGSTDRHDSPPDLPRRRRARHQTDQGTGHPARPDPASAHPCA